MSGLASSSGGKLAGEETVLAVKGSLHSAHPLDVCVPFVTMLFCDGRLRRKLSRKVLTQAARSWKSESTTLLWLTPFLRVTSKPPGLAPARLAFNFNALAASLNRETSEQRRRVGDVQKTATVTYF